MVAFTLYLFLMHGDAEESLPVLFPSLRARVLRDCYKPTTPAN